MGGGRSCGGSRPSRSARASSPERPSSSSISGFWPRSRGTCDPASPSTCVPFGRAGRRGLWPRPSRGVWRSPWRMPSPWRTGSAFPSGTRARPPGLRLARPAGTLAPSPGRDPGPVLFAEALRRAGGEGALARSGTEGGSGPFARGLLPAARRASPADRGPRPLTCAAFAEERARSETQRAQGAHRAIRGARPPCAAGDFLLASSPGPLAKR